MSSWRMPTQLQLMEEIRKVQRVIRKADPGAPHETLLVLDANTGQNALAQVRAFDDALGLTGLVLTKLDGSAKGGVVAAIAKERPIPLRFIGIGEGLDDLERALTVCDALSSDKVLSGPRRKTPEPEVALRTLIRPKQSGTFDHA